MKYAFKDWWFVAAMTCKFQKPQTVFMSKYCWRIFSVNWAGLIRGSVYPTPNPSGYPANHELPKWRQHAEKSHRFFEIFNIVAIFVSTLWSALWRTCVILEHKYRQGHLFTFTFYYSFTIFTMIFSYEKSNLQSESSKFLLSSQTDFFELFHGNHNSVPKCTGGRGRCVHPLGRHLFIFIGGNGKWNNALFPIISFPWSNKTVFIFLWGILTTTPNPYSSCPGVLCSTLVLVHPT